MSVSIPSQPSQFSGNSQPSPLQPPRIPKSMKLTLSEITRIQPEQTYIIGNNPCSTHIKYLTGLASIPGTTYFIDPSAKFSTLSDRILVSRFNQLIDDYYDFLGISDSNELKELAETLGADGMQEEATTFISESEEAQDFIEEAHTLNYPYLNSLIRKLEHGKISDKNKLKTLANSQKKSQNSTGFTPKCTFIPRLPDFSEIHSRTMIIVFNSPTIPKDSRLLSLLNSPSRSVNVIVYEHKTELPVNYWRIGDMYPLHFNQPTSEFYKNKTKHLIKNFI